LDLNIFTTMELYTEILNQRISFLILQVLSCCHSLGYLHITDFGIARIWNPNNAQDTSGTPGYMGNTHFVTKVAPEVMCRSNHGVAADYFAVGVIAYECMMGKVIGEY